MLYCSKHKKHTNKACPKKIIMITNIKIKGVSKRSKCLAVKSFVDKIKGKHELETIVTQFLFH